MLTNVRFSFLFQVRILNIFTHQHWDLRSTAHWAQTVGLFHSMNLRHLRLFTLERTRRMLKVFSIIVENVPNEAPRASWIIIFCCALLVPPSGVSNRFCEFSQARNRFSCKLDVFVWHLAFLAHRLTDISISWIRKVHPQATQCRQNFEIF